MKKIFTIMVAAFVVVTLTAGVANADTASCKRRCNTSSVTDDELQTCLKTCGGNVATDTGTKARKHHATPVATPVVTPTPAPEPAPTPVVAAAPTPVCGKGFFLSGNGKCLCDWACASYVGPALERLERGSGIPLWIKVVLALEGLAILVLIIAFVVNRRSILTQLKFHGNKLVSLRGLLDNTVGKADLPKELAALGYVTRTQFARLSQLGRDISAKESELKVAKAAVEKLGRASAALDSEMTSAEQAVVDAEMALAALGQKRADLADKALDVDDTEEAAKKAFREERKALTDATSKAKAAVTEAKVKRDSKLEAFEAERKDFDKNLALAKGNVDALTAELGRLKFELANGGNAASAATTAA